MQNGLVGSLGIPDAVLAVRGGQPTTSAAARPTSVAP